MLLAVQVPARAGPLLVAPIVNPRSVLAWCQSWPPPSCSWYRVKSENVVGHAKTVSAVAPSRATGTEQVTFADLTPAPQAAPHQQSEACW